MVRPPDRVPSSSRLSRRALLHSLALAGVALAAPRPALAASDGVALLRQWLHDIRGARCDFTQSVVAAGASAPQVSSGEFAFERPGRFRWIYRKPYRQDIVSDGSTIWTYDHDLDQVTISTQSQALGATPAALLAGADVESVFALQALPPRDGLQWAQATPRRHDSSFAWVRLGLRATAHGPELDRMELRDAFRRTSTIRFTAQQDNPTFAPGSFVFTPPPGAAVIRADQS